MNVIRLALLLLVFALAASPTSEAQGKKVLKYAFPISETGFDPGRTSDLYSAYVNAAIFDSLMIYDYFARPYHVIPNTILAEPPMVSADAKVFTFRLKPGIYFSDDPAFKGKKRELVAEDFAYSLKRHHDPKLRSPQLYLIEGKIAGLAALQARAKAEGRFDYDAPVEGLKALDRYTLQITLSETNYTWLMQMAGPSWGAVAREVIEAYGEDSMAHPVGTNAYQLKFWKRGTRTELERNPNYREDYWNLEIPPNDAWAADVAKRLRGKRLPLIDEIHYYVVEEQQPRWLAFLNEEHDFIERVAAEYSTRAFPLGKLAADLRNRGIQMDRLEALDITFTYFNMDDPVFGGYTPDRVALRRAIVMGYDNADEINIVRRGQAISAHSPIPPGANGFDRNFRATPAEYNLPRAKALLDIFGYVDKDGDGWRDQPDGSPLIFKRTSTPAAWDKDLDELWLRALNDLRIKLEVRKQKWPDSLKQANAGLLQSWGLAQSLGVPDGEEIMSNFYGPNAGPGNFARFRNADFDRLYEQARVTPIGPERNALWARMNNIVLAYAPWKFGANRIYTNLAHPWVIGSRMNPAKRSWWKYVDIDLEAQSRRR
jgi:ABC-type transport system substrate-binding protein